MSSYLEYRLVYYSDTVAWITRQWGIISASILALVLIGGAYFVASETFAPRQVDAIGATALLQEVATRDSNGDGLPDWEKVLYGIPVNATTTDYFGLGMTDGEAVAKGLIVPKALTVPQPTESTSTPNPFADLSLPPAPKDDTITATFARNFFTFYVATQQANAGEPLSQEQMKQISQESLKQLYQSVTISPKFKSINDLKISASGSVDLKIFAISAENILIKNTSTATTSGLVYLKQALENKNSHALSYIASLSKTYSNGAAGLSVLPVPQELVGADLELINAFARLGDIMNDFTKVNTDPLAALLALKQYPQATFNLGKAFTDIANIYATKGISLPNGAPGAAFVNLIADIAIPQTPASTKP